MGRAAYRCCVKNCGFTGEMSHRFPNPKLFLSILNEWVQVIGPEQFHGISPEQIYYSKRVCSNHFTPTCYSLGTKMLKRNSVPTLQILSETDLPQTVNLSTLLLPAEITTDQNNTVMCNISLMSDISGVGILNDDNSEYDLLSYDVDNDDVAVFEKASSSFVVSNAEDASSVAKVCVAKKSSGVLCKIDVKRANQLTPRCKSLYPENVILNKHLRCIKKRCLKFKDRLSVAEKMSDTLINSKLTSHMTKASAIFTRLQLRETNNKAKGRRFTLEEKLLSLSLYKRGAKSYDLLSKLFTLPGRRTLTNLLSKIPTDTGIDKTLIKVLKENVKNLSSKQRFCVVLFDEVSLDGNIQYNDSTGSISGFEDNGLSRTQHFADHSLVFMIRGVVKKYKQPMSYTFCKSTTSSHDLAHQIRKVLQAIHSTGLKVVATICDQGATNTAAINILKNNTKAEYFKKKLQYKNEFYEVKCDTENLRVIHLYDPPHLLKGIQNNLLNKNVIFNVNGQQKEASWEDAVALYNIDSNIEDVRMLPRLTSEHIERNKIKKMKVKNAVQVLSKRVSSIMSYLSSEYCLS